MANASFLINESKNTVWIFLECKVDPADKKSANQKTKVPTTIHSLYIYTDNNTLIKTAHYHATRKGEKFSSYIVITV